jgi:hypothetical protein
MDSFLAEITKFLPLLSGALALFAGGFAGSQKAGGQEFHPAPICIDPFLFNQLTDAELSPN